MTTEPRPALTDAARAICLTAGVSDPDAASSSAYDAPRMWEMFLPHASAAGASFARSLRAMAEEARAAALTARDQLAAERQRARASALHEAAGMLDEAPAPENVVEFRRK